jgi:uncharacterized protein (DUF1330 family)
MKKGYWVVAYRNDSDTEAMKAYAALVGPIVAAAGAKPLVRGLPAEATEVGEVKRTVVLEFESLQKALDTYHSPEYAQAKAALGTVIERDFRIVEGAE